MKNKRRSITKGKRFEVFKRDHFTCRYCGAKAPSVKLCIDHVLPVVQGGTNEMENLVTACTDCNLGKGGVYNDEPGLCDVTLNARHMAERFSADVAILARRCGVELSAFESGEADQVFRVFGYDHATSALFAIDEWTFTGAILPPASGRAFVDALVAQALRRERLAHKLAVRLREYEPMDLGDAHDMATRDLYRTGEFDCELSWAPLYMENDGSRSDIDQHGNPVAAGAVEAN